MEKTIGIALNRFSTIPHSLRETPSINAPRKEAEVSLASLYHHYYLDSYGRTPPDPDPAQFEYLQFLLPTKEFRVRGDGIGVSTVIRRHSSTELGQAFCRWFLHDHLNITYFAHMEHVLGRELHRAFRTSRVERTNSGDTPRNKEFASWRSQFGRVAIKDAAGRPKQVKGYIVATRFSTEENPPSVKSTLFAEDPESPGDGLLGDAESRELAGIVLAVHYAGIALKLGQPILAAALSTGFLVPDEIRFAVVIWEFQTPPLKGQRFVGGYYPSFGGSLPIRQINGRLTFDAADVLRLDVGRGTFFGVEETIFRQVVAMARGGATSERRVSQFEHLEPFYSGISVLRDGSVIGPLEFFTPVEPVAM